MGGLGKDSSLACVSDVDAEGINVQNALYGVRIKTWQVGQHIKT
jgi:galacturan 1,4-alpha-galacturonidase